MKVTNTELALLSGLMLAEYRKAGKRTPRIPEARRRLDARGYTLGGISNGHLSCLLRERCLDLRSRIAQVQRHADIDRQAGSGIDDDLAHVVSRDTPQQVQGSPDHFNIVDFLWNAPHTPRRHG